MENRVEDFRIEASTKFVDRTGSTYSRHSTGGDREPVEPHLSRLRSSHERASNRKWKVILSKQKRYWGIPAFWSSFSLRFLIYTIAENWSAERRGKQRPLLQPGAGASAFSNQFSFSKVNGEGGQVGTRNTGIIFPFCPSTFHDVYEALCSTQHSVSRLRFDPEHATYDLNPGSDISGKTFLIATRGRGNFECASA